MRLTLKRLKLAIPKIPYMERKHPSLAPGIESKTDRSLRTRIYIGT